MLIMKIVQKEGAITRRCSPALTFFINIFIFLVQLQTYIFLFLFFYFISDVVFPVVAGIITLEREFSDELLNPMSQDYRELKTEVENEVF